MASVPWLAELPQVPLYESYGETMGANKLSFSGDVGDPIERVRFTAVSDPATMTFYMTRAQYAAFRNYYKVTLGHGVLLFNLYDRVLQAVKEYKIASDPAMFPVGPDGFKVSFDVLRKP
jgi:hypothetical protein